MMHVVKRSILLTQPLQRVPRHSVPAVVVDSFHDRNGGEAYDLPGRQAREHQREGGADCIKYEGFGEGVVKSPEGIRDIDTVVVSMNVAYWGIIAEISQEIWASSRCGIGRYLFIQGVGEELDRSTYDTSTD